MAIKPPKEKFKVALFKFSSCAGCQLEFVHFGTELLSLMNFVDFRIFYEVSSAVEPGPYDLGIVEGAITSPEEMERLNWLRENSNRILSLGLCASLGGVFALKNYHDVEELKARVYADPKIIDTFEKSLGVDQYIKVDDYLPGCPVSAADLREYLLALALGRPPQLKPYAVCVECKEKANLCLVTAHNEMCMGSMTRAGCGSLCPSNGRPCYGCRGPHNDANPVSLGAVFEQHGWKADDIMRRFQNFAGESPVFRQGAQAYER